MIIPGPDKNMRQILRFNMHNSHSASPPKVHSRSVDPQKNCRNYLIISSNFLIYNTVDPRYSAVLLIYISAVGSKTKKLAVLP